MICSCSELIKPLNYYEYTLGYQTISDLDWLNEKTFLAVVSNPIFMTKVEWWDVCCNIYSGNVEVQH